MSTPQTPSPQPPQQSSRRVAGRLFEAGARLGWVFRDRNQFRRAFGLPYPPEPPLPPGPGRASPAGYVVPAVIGGALLVGVVCCGSLFASNGSIGLELALGAVGVFGLLAAVGGPLMVMVRRQSAERHHRTVVEDLTTRHRASVEQWQRHRQAHEAMEGQALDRMPEWGAAALGPSPGARSKRIDLVGGNLWGWEAFLTVFGSSMLGSRRNVTVLDLSYEVVSRELIGLAEEAGYRTDAAVLPAQLAQLDLQLDAEQLVDVLVESMHGDETDANRAARAMDARILGTVCSALEPNVTVARLAEALRVLMGEPGAPAGLSAQERDRIAGGLFSAEYVAAARESLRRIDALLAPLERLGGEPTPLADVPLRCVVVAGDGSSARSELLADLLVQWAMRLAGSGGRDKSGDTLIVAGADRVRRRHLERLSDICERRGIQLVYVFRHLRETSLELLGGGTVGFMKLGNHAEAEQAAAYIGRGHRFVLSRLTHSLGGEQTHTDTTSERESSTEQPARRPSLDWRSLLVTVASPKTRTWGKSSSVASGEQWSAGETRQRVYEFRVEPTVLQHLPDYAMLLVRSEHTGPVTVPVEFNPDLVSVPGVLTSPLPPPEQYLPAIEGPHAQPAYGQQQAPGRPPH